MSFLDALAQAKSALDASSEDPVSPTRRKLSKALNMDSKLNGSKRCESKESKSDNEEEKADGKLSAEDSDSDDSDADLVKMPEQKDPNWFLPKWLQVRSAVHFDKFQY
jgi:hypothetical protein